MQQEKVKPNLEHKITPTCRFVHKNDGWSVAEVIIPRFVVSALFDAVAHVQSAHVLVSGFSSGETPLAYIKKEFRVSIIAYLKEFLFKYCVLNFLMHQLRKEKIVVIGSPILATIFLDFDQDAIFTFDIPNFSGVAVQEWKLLPFKMPRRKNYRDIDRQVDTFIKQEQTITFTDQIEWGDWIQLKIALVDQKGELLFDGYEQDFWFCMRDEEVENPLQNMLLGRTVGDVIIVRDRTGFYDLFSHHLDGVLPLRFKIEHIVPFNFFCFEKFKKHFRLKSQKDAHKKLIEVFSFRNDISQRNCIVDEAFKLMLSKHRFAPPVRLVQQLEAVILQDIKKKLDYSVYKREKNFDRYVKQLAEKQAREILFSDILAFHEGLDIDDEDVCGYLNLTSRARTNQLLHFQLPLSRRGGTQVPLNAEDIKQICLREKALNFIIHNLTR